jgi:hypothetical protein
MRLYGEVKTSLGCLCNNLLTRHLKSHASHGSPRRRRHERREEGPPTNQPPSGVGGDSDSETQASSLVSRQFQSFLSLTPPTSHHDIHVVRAAEYPQWTAAAAYAAGRTRPRRKLAPFPLQLCFFRRGCYRSLLRGLCSCGCSERCGCATVAASLFFL